MHKYYKFMCLSAYWQWELANERPRISAVIVKKNLHAEVEIVHPYVQTGMMETHKFKV